MAIAENEIIEALKSNPNAAEIARQAGVAKSTVWKIAKKQGIELVAGRAAKGLKLIPTNHRIAIIEALEETGNASQVAREIGGVTRSTVWRISKKKGIKLAREREEMKLDCRAAALGLREALDKAHEDGDHQRIKKLLRQSSAEVLAELREVTRASQKRCNLRVGSIRVMNIM